MRAILCGDFVPTAASVPAFEAGDLAALLGDTLDVLRAGDIAVANLECALTDRDAPIRKCGPNLKGKPDYAKLKPVLFEMPTYKYLRTGDIIGDCMKMGKAYGETLK